MAECINPFVPFPGGCYFRSSSVPEIQKKLFIKDEKSFSTLGEEFSVWRGFESKQMAVCVFRSDGIKPADRKEEVKSLD